MSIEVVRRVKDQLVAAGVDLSGPCGAFNITHRVAWELRNDGWGLISKEPAQNGCTFTDGNRYGVDTMMLRDGTVIDMLINSETENTPAWQVVGSLPGDRWRTPVQPAPLPDQPPVDPPVPGPTPTPVPPSNDPNWDRLWTELEDLSERLTDLEVTVSMVGDSLGDLLAKPAPVYKGRMVPFTTITLKAEGA